MSEKFKDILLASNFSNGKLTEYRYSWFYDEFYIKGRQRKYTYPGKAERKELCFLILRSFDLIEVYIPNSYIFFRDAGLKSRYENTPGQYIIFKDLLVAIAKNQNTLKYKFCIVEEGVLIWKDNPKCPIFFEAYWTTFVKSILYYFKISLSQQENLI